MTERGKKRRERERGGEGWTNKRRRKVGRVSSARDRSAKLSASPRVTIAGGPVFNPWVHR